MSKTLHRRLPVAGLVLALLLLTLACAGEAEPTPTPTPAATATPTPAPTPSVGDILTTLGANVAAMTSAKISMIDEFETGAKFFGTTFKSMEAEIEAPSNVRMMVDVVAPGFGFVEIEIVRVGDRTFMKLSKDAPWVPLPLDQVPFDFTGLAKIFSKLPLTIQQVSIAGFEEVQGHRTIRVEGVVDSEDLSDLITSADSGYSVTVTMWVDVDEFVLRQLRLTGQIYDDDGPETSRLINVENINAAVTIELPDTASGQ